MGWIRTNAGKPNRFTAYHFNHSVTISIYDTYCTYNHSLNADRKLYIKALNTIKVKVTDDTKKVREIKTFSVSSIF